MQKENWVIIKTFDKYMVSDRGRVFSQKNRKVLKKICGKGGAFNSCSKRVLQIQDNKVIGRYYGCCEASREAGVCRQNISSCCNHKYNKAGGFIWKFED